MNTLDPVRNIAIASLSSGISASGSTLTLQTGYGANFPNAVVEGQFNIIVWDYTASPDPVSATDYEIVTVTSGSADTFTITRGQEGTSAVAHNTVGDMIKVALVPTKKMIDAIRNAAFGTNFTNTGTQAHTEGNNNIASGNYSHAEGSGNLASGNSSHAEGSGTQATNSGSHAEGSTTSASSASSHAEGSLTYALNTAAHAEGSETYASGLASHAEGSNTSAGGDYSHAEGVLTQATGKAAHSAGNTTTAQGYAQYTIGQWNILNGVAAVYTPSNQAFIIGNGTSSSNLSDAFYVDFLGNTFISGSILGSALMRGNGAFTGTSTSASVTIPNALSTDYYQLTPNGSTVNQFDVLSYVAGNGVLNIYRPASGSSGLNFTWFRMQ
jgi:hypothetical protein